MKYIFYFSILFFVTFQNCDKPKPLSSTKIENWEKRNITTSLPDSLQKGSTFLSIYSQIYMRDESVQSDLTATVSLHNPNIHDSIYVNSAVYYNTHGEAIRTYFDKTIFIKPLETVQIIIDETDKEGGTGANFIFNWQCNEAANDPIFEAIMISTYGQQGISFVTQGKRLK